MSVLFWILLVLYAVLLELSKNTIIGWIVLALVAVAFVILKCRRKKFGFPAFLLCVAVLGLNYWLTQPPVRQVPAVLSGQPEVTEVVQVQQGKLTGVYNEDHTARIYAGIPYAKPPTGDLRWKEPQAPESWEGIRACDTFGPMAMQNRSSELMNSLQLILGYHYYQISLQDNFREAMSEDCLYLNVFAPAEESREPLPVLFYIHGGGLTGGQSYYGEYRGEDLARQGIIVVNFGYRLGVFGYYASEELAAESENGTTGAYGLLDQIAALSWVRENIAAFGGDPDRITIAGESAGASSVNALCVSPLTGGMFERAIAASSGLTARHPYHTFRTMESALTMGQDIMAEMGAKDIREMRSLSAEALLKTKHSNDSMTVDGYAITEMPWQTYQRGANHEKALLNGFNGHEADAFLLGTKATKENYVSLLEPIFGNYAQEAAELVPAESVPQQYKIFLDPGGEAKGSLNYLYSAAWFAWSHELWSTYVAAQDKPVYEYLFTMPNKAFNDYHSRELPYVFGNLWRYPGMYSAGDEALSRIMQAYWVNFVKTGNPNGGTLPRWEPYSDRQKQLIELGNEVRMREDPYREVYPLLEKYQESLSGGPEPSPSSGG